MVTNSSGAILDDADFYPFGGERPIVSTSGNTYKFTGKERDTESGLDYFGARYFASLQGRFTSPDLPFVDQHLANPQSWNLYTYVRNNPISYLDPDGHLAEFVGGQLRNVTVDGIQLFGDALGLLRGKQIEGTFVYAILRIAVLRSSNFAPEESDWFQAQLDQAIADTEKMGIQLAIETDKTLEDVSGDSTELNQNLQAGRIHIIGGNAIDFDRMETGAGFVINKKTGGRYVGLVVNTSRHYPTDRQVITHELLHIFNRDPWSWRPNWVNHVLIELQLYVLNRSKGPRRFAKFKDVTKLPL